MMESYMLKKAELNQLPAAMELINDGKQYLKEQGATSGRLDIRMRRTFWRISARERDILSLTGHSLSAGKASRGKGISEAVFHLAEGTVPKPRRQEHAGGHR